MTEGISVDVRALRRKVRWRLLPLLFTLYIVAYVDRANVAFAKLRMAGALGFSDEVFGLGIGIFFFGYLILEIPGALLVERWSARKWFARILVSWGLISALTAFVHTPGQFYFARFALGLAEAGFFPGVIVYFMHWFPERERSRALAGLIMAVPVGLALCAPVSAWLLDVNWLGLVGWQWVFVLEGVPAIGLGVFTWFWLPDRPRDARWLAPAERAHLEEELASEARAKDADEKITVVQALKLPRVWHLAAAICVTNTGGYALVFWLPTIMSRLAGGSVRAALYYTGLFYLCGVLGAFLSGISSGRSGNRKWHCVVAQISTGVLLAVSAIPQLPFAVAIGVLCLTAVAALSWGAPFWALPTLTLSASAAAAAIGLISMSANISGYIGNHATGWLRDHGLGDSGCLLFFAGCYVAGGILVSLVKIAGTPPT